MDLQVQQNSLKEGEAIMVLSNTVKYDLLCIVTSESVHEKVLLLKYVYN